MSCPEKDNSLNSGYMTCYTSFERSSQGEELLCITGREEFEVYEGKLERERKKMESAHSPGKGQKAKPLSAGLLRRTLIE